MKARLALCATSLFGGTLFAQSLDSDLFASTFSNDRKLIVPQSPGSIWGVRGIIYRLGTGPRGRGSAAVGVREGKIGLQLGFFNNIELERHFETDFDDNPIPPPPGSRFLGNFRTDPGAGVDFLFYPGDRHQSPYIGVGLYYEATTQVFRLPSTGQLYPGGSTSILRGAFSLGFTGDLGDGNELGIGYHTLLGWNISYMRRYR